MIELDCWLAPLERALADEPRLVGAVEALLAHEPDALQAMMEGRRPLPEPLARLLD